jgi:hypothetical protein
MLIGIMTFEWSQNQYELFSEIDSQDNMQI